MLRSLYAVGCSKPHDFAATIEQDLQKRGGQEIRSGDAEMPTFGTAPDFWQTDCE